MKLKCGKEHVLELEHMPLESRLVRGRRIFEPTQVKAARAAFLANRVVARTFQKTFTSEADRASNVAIDADRVDVAVYRDETGKHRVVYREAIVRFAPQAPVARRKAL